MTDQTSAPAGESSAPADMSEISLDDAVSIIAENRFKKDNNSADGAEDATADKELADKANADPAEQDHGEDEEADAEETLPPIERPKSWASDDQEEWDSLPRARQEKIAKRERDTDVRISQKLNEVAEKLKGATAKEQQAEQATQALAAKLPEIDAAIQRFLVTNYPDIKTQADVTRMAAEDPFRKIQWDAHQQEIAAARMDANEARAKAERDIQSSLTTYKNEQDKLFLEAEPELADPKKKAEITEKVIEDLTGKDIGFTLAQLNEFAANPVAARLLFSAGFQKLALNNRKFSELKSAPAKVLTKPVPNVQRPGAAAPKGAENSARIQALEKQFERTGSVDDAFALRMARQKRA